MPYFIIPSENSDLEVDPDFLSRQLIEQWPMVEFRQPMPNETILLEWEIKAGKINHVGTLHSNKGTLAIDDYPLGVSEFALWYRQIIPEKYDIFLCHDSDASLEVRITRETSANEILKQLESDA
jgi:hypothetical protein